MSQLLPTPMLLENGRDVVLDQFRYDSFLTDVTLVTADGIRLPAHRPLLAASSSFFYAFFRNQQQQQQQQHQNETVIELPLLSSWSMIKCLEVAYLGTTTIGQQDEIEDLLKTATFLQMQKAVEICEQTLQNAISSHNMDDIYTLADRYSLSQTLTALQQFLERRLVKIARKDSHLCRISFRQMVELLKSDRLAISESNLLSIVTKWLEATGERLNHNSVSAVLREIRLMLVDHDLLISLLPIAHELSTSCDTMNDGSNVTAFGRVFEALDYLSKPYMQPTVTSKQNQLRAHSRIAIRVAGKLLLSNSEEILQAELIEQNSREPGTVEIVTQLPEAAVSHHQAVALNGFVFVIGGAKTICQRGLTAVNSVWRFDPRSNRWWQAEHMAERRAYFAAGTIDNKIYVAGGEFRFVASRTCETYNPATNKWTFIAPLPDEFSGNAGCGGADGCFYTFGGWKGDDANGDICADVYRYHVDRDYWEKLPEMRHDRAFHCCVPVDDLKRIYVFGGVDHRKRPISYGEYLDLDLLTWHPTEPVPSMHNEGACFPVYNADKKIIAICICGGYDAANKPQSVMSLYDLEKNAWSTWQSSTFHRFLRFAGSCFVSVDFPVVNGEQQTTSDLPLSLNGWTAVAPTNNNNIGGNNNERALLMVRTIHDGRGAASANRRSGRRSIGDGGRHRAGANNNNGINVADDDDDDDDDDQAVDIDHDYSF